MKRKEINVLIACEESQTECLAFRLQGFNAYSCDIKPTSNCYPEYHIQGDVTEIFYCTTPIKTQNGNVMQLNKWHLIIAHPPCTYLSRAGSRYLFPGKQLNDERYELGLQAKDFLLKCLDAPAQFVCVENPIPNRIFDLPRPTTKIQPYEFGEPWRKTTLLWLRNLPPLMPVIYNPNMNNYVQHTRGGTNRSKSFPAIAKAMAIQWGNYIEAQLNLK